MTDTVPGRFASLASRFGARPLFVVKRDGAYQSISWREAAEQVEALAAFLLAHDVRPGDRVLVLSENRPEWGLADLAIQSIGAWTVPIYATLPSGDVRDICGDCKPVLAIVSSAAQADKLPPAEGADRGIRRIVVMEGPVPSDSRAISWAEALRQGRAEGARWRQTLEQRRSALRPDGTATLIYTSGTTGEPKGVMLSHRNFLSNVEACLQVIPITEMDRHLSFLPLSHVFERMAGWYLMLSAGASVAFAESMETIPQNMLEVRPTVMLGVPRFFEKLYGRIQDAMQQAPARKRRLIEWALRVGRAAARHRLEGRQVPVGLALQRWLGDHLVFRKLRGRLGGRLRFFVSGSAPLSAEIGEFFFSVGVTILEGYGLTESSPVIACNRLPVPRFGTVGPPIPGVEVRIAEDGEIFTRGPHVMQGYYRKPEATAEVVTDGWLHTGDMGRLDPDGCLRITDRKKDLIKTAGGKFVAPQKLETLFVTDPLVSQAFVYGDRERYCVALIVPNFAALQEYAQEQGIRAGSRAELVRDERVRQLYWQRIQERQHGCASFEQVKAIALLDQEFTQATGELTPTLKAKRGIIAERYAELLRQLYAAPAA